MFQEEQPLQTLAAPKEKNISAQENSSRFTMLCIINMLQEI